MECRGVDGQPDHLLVLEVDPSNQVHVNNRDEVSLRVGDENRRLTFVQRSELVFDKGQAAYEATPISGTSIADTRDSVVNDYAAALGHPVPERLRMLP